MGGERDCWRCAEGRGPRRERLFNMFLDLVLLGSGEAMGDVNGDVKGLEIGEEKEEE